MKKYWRRDEYTDRLSGKLIGVEILPLLDLREHKSDESCDCIPRFDEKCGVQFLIHSAFDGRELDEANSETLSH